MTAVDPAEVKKPPLEPQEAEAMLREALVGKRLIFELGFDEAEFHRFRRPLFVALRRLTVKQLRFQYPALLTTYMALAGTFLYEGGELYTKFHPSISDPDSELGMNFLLALRKLDLEDFGALFQEDKTAKRWITRILAQGGIPRSCLRPFAELVAREIDAGAPDARSMLATWRSRGASLTGIHVPTRRFLLYGGDTSTDLVQRCIDLLRDRARTGKTPSAADAGLPQYVVDGFESVDQDTSRVRRRAEQHSALVPRPVLLLDPFDGLGPVISLPPVGSDQLGGSWRVEAGGRVHRQDPSSYAVAQLRVPPVSVAEVEFLNSEGVRRRWSFDLLGERPVLFFDPQSTSRMRQATVLAAEETWVLSAAATALHHSSTQETIREVQNFPALNGDWSGFVVRHLDLQSVSGIAVDDGFGRSAVIPVVAPKAVPLLHGDPVPGVSVLGGVPVYPSVPTLVVPMPAGLPASAWQVQVDGPGGRLSTGAPDSRGCIDLQATLGEECFGAFRLRVRGALGSDATLRFAVVPQLSVRRPDGISLPGGDTPSVTASSPGISLQDSEPGSPVTLGVADDASTGVVLTARCGAQPTLDLRIDVPRLLWTIVHDTKPQLEHAARVIRVDAEEFDDHLADLLLVDVGRPGVGMALELRDRDQQLLASSPVVTTAGSSGRWTFDLGQFADTIRSGTGARLALHLRLGVRSVHLADVITGVHVSAVVAHANDDDEIVVTFNQQRRVDDRVIRLWSSSQPWRSPVVRSVPDGAAEIAFPRDGELPAGPYIAEVAVDDPWRELVRPRAASDATRPIHVGSRAELHEWLIGLDGSDPLSLLTWVLNRHHGETSFETAALMTVAPEIAVTLRTLMSETGPGQVAGRAFKALASVVTARDCVLVAVLGALAELGLPEADSGRIVLRLLEHLDPTSDELDAQAITTVWRIAPAVAATLDLPRAAHDPIAGDRCRLHLGWGPTDDMPASAGARIGGLELNMAAQQLRDLRFAIGLQPSGVLDAQTRMVASFEWLLNQAEARDDDESRPEAWFWRHRSLLEVGAETAPPDVRAHVEEHIAARTAARGTAPWASVPAVLLTATALTVWPGPATPAALLALDEAFSWASRAISADATLLTALPTIRRMASA
jgi:hypothetical protein